MIIQSLVSCVVNGLMFFQPKVGYQKNEPTRDSWRENKYWFQPRDNLFGLYALFYTGTINNMNKRRSIPLIELKKSNDHGVHYLMRLYTGKRLHR